MTNPVSRNIKTPFEWAEFFPTLQQDVLHVPQWKDFSLKRYDFTAVKGILAWVVGDTAVTDHLGIDQGKGLLIRGTPGIGKSTFIRLLHRMDMKKIEHPKPFHTIQCSALSNAYALEGRKALQPILQLSCCFDNLGREMTTSHFSQRFELMQHVLLDRADDFVTTGLITHLTTNLSGDEIEKRYGWEVRSKMKFMFNQIVLDR